MDLGALSTHAIFSDPPMQSEAEDSSQVAEGSKRKKRNRKSKKLSEDNTEESIPPSKSPSKPKANKKAKIVELGGRYGW